MTLLVKSAIRVPLRRKFNLRWYSADSGEQLRVAIVGGGAAGLSTALHLAPLVERGLIAKPIDIFEGGSHNGSGPIGREIGVGVWSTGIKQLSYTGRQSHNIAWKRLLDAGRWVGEVGYKTPKGAWLARSYLPSTPTIANGDDLKNEMPRLIFMREKDLLSSLREAVKLEEQAGTVNLVWEKDSKNTQIAGISNESKPWSASLSFAGSDEPSERDYHLIIAADGCNSKLRQLYGGHRLPKTTGMMGLNALPGPLDNKLNSNSGSQQEEWEAEGQTTANAIEDRQYTVFRGNANMSNADTGMDGISFQTWGEGKSMRFATVPMAYTDDAGQRVEKQVWFITTNEPSICDELDPTKRREMLLDLFANWHEPIPQLVKATPPEEILMERAIAHKHSMGPVLNVNQVLQYIQQTSQPLSGPGPALVFIGDAYMTVDPILAQGFTMSLEASSSLANTLENCIRPPKQELNHLAFDPYALRAALQERHGLRERRLIHLLRATELVQSLGQPDSKTIAGMISRAAIRPLMRISPDFIKRPIFDYMLKYSLDVV